MIPTLDRHRAGAGELCDASGWKVRTSCADRSGRVCCPLCQRRVPAHATGRRVVELDHHEASHP